MQPGRETAECTQVIENTATKLPVTTAAAEAHKDAERRGLLDQDMAVMYQCLKQAAGEQEKGAASAPES